MTFRGVRVLLALLVVVGSAGAQTCPSSGDPTKPAVLEGKLCSAQTGNCAAGLVCAYQSGCHCVAAGTGTATTTRPPATSTPTTRPIPTTIPATGCQTAGKQPTAMLPTCCPGLVLMQKPGVSGFYCLAVTTTVPTLPPAVTTTRASSTLPPTSTTMLVLPPLCSDQLPCAPPLVCRVVKVGSDGRARCWLPENPTSSTPSSTGPSSTVVSTTSLVSTTSRTTTTLPVACSVREEGKACNAQARCCAPLVCDTSGSGSDVCRIAAPANGGTGPVRPPDGDLNIGIQRNENLLYAGLGGRAPHAANQTERDAMEWALVKRAAEATLLVARTVNPMGGKVSPGAPYCASAVSYCYSASGLPAILNRLGTDYEARALCGARCELGSGGGIWDVPADGRHYSFTRICLERIATCLLEAPLDCAARLASDPPMQALLNIQVANGRCTPVPFVSPPLPPADSTRDDEAPVNTNVPQLAPTGISLAALERTHVAHLQQILQCQGFPTDPSVETAGVAHVRYEALCNGDATCTHFRQMKPFGPAVNSRWTNTDGCRWKQITHAFHGRWMACQQRGDWACSRETDTDHFNAHWCMNDGNENVKVLFSCGTGAHITDCQWPNGQRGKVTCRDALPMLAARFGVR